MSYLPAKLPAFADIGKQASELLVGGKIGLYQYDQKLTVSTKAANGVAVSLKAVNPQAEPGDLRMEVKGSVVQGPVTVDVLATAKAAPKATVTYAQPLLEGLKLTLAGSIPAPEKTSTLTLDYCQPYLTSRAAIGLNANPELLIGATTGYNGFIAGASATVEVTKSLLKDAKMAVGYMGPTFVVTGHSDIAFKTVMGTYWQQLDAASTVGAEVIHTPGQKATALLMGYSHVNTLDGTMTKVKLGNDGSVHFHREMPVAANTTLAFSASVNAKNMSEPPRMGFAIDHSP